MFRRIFLLCLAIAAIVMAAVSFYAYSWLGSIGDPGIASSGFVFHTSFAWSFLWISFVVLAVFSVYLAWRTGAKWPAVSTYGYFVLFMLALLFNDGAYRDFLSDNLLTTDYVLLNPFFAAVIFLVAAVFMIAAYMLTINVRIKIKKESKEPAPEEKEDKKEEN